MRYTCVLGFSGSGSSEYSCHVGQWIRGNLGCSQIFCPGLAPPRNCIITNTPLNIPGTRTTFACNRGYDLIGSEALDCLINGTWRPEFSPTCNIRRCPNTPFLDNGRLVPLDPGQDEYVYDSSLVVECDLGFVVLGKYKDSLPRRRYLGNPAWLYPLRVSVSPRVNKRILVYEAIMVRF